jgi:PAS domain S-box-containing protein
MRTTPPDLAHSALDAAPDAMVIIDEAGIVLFANRQSSALFGYAHAELVGAGIESLMPERFRARHLGHREHYVAHLRVRPMGAGFELFGRRRDGSEFPVEISLSPIEGVGRTLFAAAIRDVTDRKHAESELKLARQAAEAARELADRANRGKSRFLATASHDLRQPLQSVELLNGAMRRLTTDARLLGAIAEQEQAIGSMSRLLNALLDISKLESGAIRPEPTDFSVAGMFEELRVEFAGLAASKGLRFEVETCEDAVYSDPSLVEQILRNLVSNAVKYTREGWVRLRCRHLGPLVRIEVLDTGVGIAPHQMPYIYDEFYQAGVAPNSSREGYGLGLSIVQRLVNLLMLKLDVHSEVGRGSAFGLELPSSNGHRRAARRAMPVPEPQPELERGGGARILVVEDNESVRRAMCRLLELEGYRVTQVATLAEALGHVRDGHGIDVLICDYHLSDGITGSEVIAALRQVLGPNLRALISTGDTSSAIRQLPRDPYLRITSKPIQAEALLQLLRSLIAT